MKKIIKTFVICAVTLAVGLVIGCKQPSDSSEGLNANEQKLVGTWKVTNPTDDTQYFLQTNPGDWYPKEIVLSSDKGVVAHIRANAGNTSWSDCKMKKAHGQHQHQV